jgi:hypothetical protein
MVYTGLAPCSTIITRNVVVDEHVIEIERPKQVECPKIIFFHFSFVCFIHYVIFSLLFVYFCASIIMYAFNNIVFCYF